MDKALAVLEVLLKASPEAANWIGGLLGLADAHPELDPHPQFTARVRDIMPEKSLSRQAAEELEAKTIE